MQQYIISAIYHRKLNIVKKKLKNIVVLTYNIVFYKKSYWLRIYDNSGSLQTRLPLTLYD
ncbi:hypothetical protein BFC17_04380 [Alteromonas lipolytica]|uniref:Uncharacterized protein n=1 Tax=Alteromonas lipolytica TaxID=1856405 RepID=A0A1E8FC55_9ALTE|nr:hypothetical protein BFC17_04380 [Alteromonas lipolytica]